MSHALTGVLVETILILIEGDFKRVTPSRAC